MPTGWRVLGLAWAFTTYQTGKPFLIGLRSDGRLAVFERSFARCMELGAADGWPVVLAMNYQLLHFDNVGARGDAAWRA